MADAAAATGVSLLANAPDEKVIKRRAELRELKLKSLLVQSRGNDVPSVQCEFRVGI